MPSRALLRAQLVAAWRRCMETDYAAQRINSERSLQASLWAQLNLILSPKNRRMFIEPRLFCEARAGGVKYPDIVVCNSRAVIAIVELKFQPRSNPVWRKDVETLRWVRNQRSSIFVANHRHRGPVIDGRSYPISRDLLCVWAGVHKESPRKIAEELLPSERKGFLELHAQTRAGEGPLVT